MRYNLTIQNEAILDIQEAFEWYEKTRGGLGFQLIQEIENCYGKISINPQHYGFVSKRHRNINTSRFPYLIKFELIANKAFVDYFLHVKQKMKNL